MKVRDSSDQVLLLLRRLKESPNCTISVDEVVLHFFKKPFHFKIFWYFSGRAPELFLPIMQVRIFVKCFSIAPFLPSSTTKLRRVYKTFHTSRERSPKDLRESFLSDRKTWFDFAFTQGSSQASPKIPKRVWNLSNDPSAPPEFGTLEISSWVNDKFDLILRSFRDPLKIPPKISKEPPEP